MADGITWTTCPLTGGGSEIRRKDFDGLAVCLISRGVVLLGARPQPGSGH
jgi:hypothetical protein